MEEGMRAERDDARGKRKKGFVIIEARLRGAIV